MSSPLDLSPAADTDRIGAAVAPETGHQLAALCWRMQGKGPEVLLITSRDTGRWIVPKGWPMQGRSPSEAAAREAWEEAGVEGHADQASIGSFDYDKTRPRAESLPCEVEVFALRVDRLLKDYPERNQRRRKWFRPEKAARKVAEPALRALILRFAAGHQTAEEQGAKKPSGGKKVTTKALARKSGAKASSAPTEQGVMAQGLTTAAE